MKTHLRRLASGAALLGLLVVGLQFILPVLIVVALTGGSYLFGLVIEEAWDEFGPADQASAPMKPGHTILGHPIIRRWLYALLVIFGAPLLIPAFMLFGLAAGLMLLGNMVLEAKAEL